MVLVATSVLIPLRQEAGAGYFAVLAFVESLGRERT